MEPPFTRYPHEHAAAIGGGQWIEQKVSGKKSRASANATISTKTVSMALRSERTAMRIAQWPRPSPTAAIRETWRRLSPCKASKPLRAHVYRRSTGPSRSGSLMGERPRPGNPKLRAGPLLPQRFGAFRRSLPQRCHTPRRYLLHPPALVAHGSVKLQQAGAAPSRGEEGRAGSRSPATSYRGPTLRRPEDDRGRNRPAEILEAIYQTLLSKLNGLSGERAAADDIVLTEAAGLHACGSSAGCSARHRSLPC